MSDILDSYAVAVKNETLRSLAEDYSRLRHSLESVSVSHPEAFEVVEAYDKIIQKRLDNFLNGVLNCYDSGCIKQFAESFKIHMKKKNFGA